MTRTTQTRDAEFEAEVRAMLARRAADVSPSPAAHRGVAAAAGPGLTPAPSDRRVHPLTARTSRPLLVAALVVVVGAAALVVRGTRPDGTDRTTTGEALPADATFPAPGAPGWDPATAPPAWPVVGGAALAQLADDPHARSGDLATPDGAAAAYLDDISILLVPDPAGLVVSADGRTAEIPWGPRGGQPPAKEPQVPTGTVHLRNVGDDTDALWVVVGAVTDGVGLEDVRIEAGTLGFTVDVGVPPPVNSLSVRVGVNGAPTPVGGAALPQGLGPPDPSAGELVPVAADGRGRVAVGVEARDRADILVRIVGGDVLSVTHMAVDVPAAQADPATAVQADTDAVDPAASASGAGDDSAAPAGDPLPTPAEPLDGTGVLALYAGRGSAVEVAQAYLDDRLPERIDGLRLDDTRSVSGTMPGGGASVMVPWHIEPEEDLPPGASDELAGRYSGEVQLRQIDGGWAVVGATTDQIVVRDLARDAGSVTFTIDRLDEAAIDSIDLALFDLDGRLVSEQLTAPLGVPGRYRLELASGIAPDLPITLRARHVGGTWFSLTEARVP